MIQLFLTLVVIVRSGCAGIKHTPVQYFGVPTAIPRVAIPADDGTNTQEVQVAKQKNIEADKNDQAILGAKQRNIDVDNKAEGDTILLIVPLSSRQL